MQRRFSALLIVGAVLTLCPAAQAQSELQKSLKDLDIAPHWIYDDLPKAFAEAKASGKPILVVLRCVPCPPGKTLDGKVMQPDKDLEKLEKEFVCVRIIQGKGLDLKLFQYDYDQSWCSVILNADRTIYGRYGSRATNGPKSDGLLSLPGFQKALERALELHKSYPGNKAQLAGKIGKEPDYRVPEEIPSLKDRAKGETVRQTCIHCHMIKDHTIRTKWLEKRLTPADLWVYPMPETIGLTLDVDDGLRVNFVTADSAAAKAGLAVGDELIALNGQPLVSTADVQWVLHTSPNEAHVAVKLQRNGKVLEKTVDLKGSWKESDIAWRVSSWYGLRQGLKLDALTPDEKKKRGLGADEMGLLVRGIFGNSAAALNKAGLKNGDVVTAMDGQTKALTESQFLADLRLKHGPSDSVKLTILRGDARMEVTIPMW
jgi:hypothetical protein